MHGVNGLPNFLFSQKDSGSTQGFPIALKQLHPSFSRFAASGILFWFQFRWSQAQENGWISLSLYVYIYICLTAPTQHQLITGVEKTNRWCCSQSPCVATSQTLRPTFSHYSPGGAATDQHMLLTAVTRQCKLITQEIFIVIPATDSGETGAFSVGALHSKSNINSTFF